MRKVIIVGGGAAGCFAAVAAADKAKVTIFEKNEKLCKKLYITGKGRCNITNMGDLDNFIENTLSNPYFLYSSLSHMTNEQTIQMFEKAGLPTKVERGGRVFPKSDKAADVVDAIKKMLTHKNIDIRLSSEVDEICIENANVTGVRSNGRVYLADAVILATGGLSYPQTGSSGDGYKFAKKMGIKITKLYPSLVSLVAQEKYCADLQGLSLKNVEIKIKDNFGKNLYSDFGEMLFTHHGVSGPVILSASSRLTQQFPTEYKLVIDLKPALSEKTLDARILSDFAKYTNKDFCNALNDLLPQKIIPVVVHLSEIPEYKKVNAITKVERHNLVKVLKNFTLTITATGGYNEAVITKGGVDVSEIDPHTMESIKIRNLFFAGELIDVDAYTGGYNLQIAFSTGYMAGMFAVGGEL